MKRRTSSHVWVMLYSECACSTLLLVASQKQSADCSRSNLECLMLNSVLLHQWSCRNDASRSTFQSCTLLCVNTRKEGVRVWVASTVKCWRLSFITDISAPVYGMHDRLSAEQFFTPALRTTSNSNSDRWNRQLAWRPVLSDKLRIHLRESWCVQILKGVLSR